MVGMGLLTVGGFPSNCCRMQTAMFSLYVVILTFALIAGAEARDPTKYSSGLDIVRAICEVLVLLYSLYGLAAEANQLYK